MASLLRAAIGVGMTLVALPAAMALVFPLLLIGQTVTAPSWITARVEAQADALLAGGAVDFGAITLTLGTDLHPRIGLRDTVLRDASGAVLARVPEVEALVSPRGLLFERQALAQEVVLRGAEIGLRRDTDGRVAVSFERDPGPAIVVEDGRASGLAGLLRQVDLVLDRPALAALEQVRAEALVINYADARAGRSWTADDGRLAIDLRGGRTDLSGRMSILSGRDYATALAVGYERADGADDAEVSVRIDRAPSSDLATQHPALSFLSVLDAPLSAALSGRIGIDGRPGPFSAALRIGAGAVAPGGAGADALRFDSARLYMRFDPNRDEIAFDEIAIDGERVHLDGRGKAWLREMRDGWPGALVAQLSLAGLTLDPLGALPAPVALEEGWLDLRLRARPFGLEIGGFGATDTETGARLGGSGRLDYRDDGWHAALDAEVDRLTPERLLDFWPEPAKPRTRDWIATRIEAGEMRDVSAALRIRPGQQPEIGLTQSFEGATVRPLDGLPPITQARGHASLGGKTFSVTLTGGGAEAPEGGRVDLAGSSFTIPELGGPRPDAKIALEAEGPVTAMLLLIDQPPFRFMTKANQPVDLIDGRARASAAIALPLGKPASPEEIDWNVAGELSDVESDRIVPGRRVAAGRLDVAVGRDALEVAGPVTIDGLPADVAFRQPLGPGAGAARLDGTVEVSQRFLDTFGIALPDGTLSGEGRADVAMTLAKGAPPEVVLSSRLDGIGLAIPALGWRLAPGTTGDLEIAGTLGATPRIDRIALDAGGLSARGSLSLRPEGGLERASFSRLRLSDWLDVSADLVGRGPGETVGVEIGSGALDLRRASFGKGGGGAGGPIRLALDRLRVTDAIALTGLRGDFSTVGGFSGRFEAEVNGGAPVSGLVVPEADGAAVRITGPDAGAVLRSAGLYGTATGGALDLALLPEGPPGHYSGELSVAGLRVRDAPAIAQLLDAASIVGLLQQLDGRGLAFDRIRADFRITPQTLTIAQSSAVGPGLGISLDGAYSLASRQMEFRGVVSPFYILNGIGSLLTRPGEGLIGFNYTLRGTPEDPAVSVNPLSALTPGMFREIFRRPVPTRQETAR
ncbi:AsmA-like C-terminal region-containing protein [Limimaricola pyoseonensis]|uniref:AsmA-like C-terminal region n=1 Tax=Limimaricola pyoseonensis TaxID=521013 RepID=A0A1G7GZZ6_9RHOB|nr:AsmA-like C-terminal region-containing protein [Limimaricola pyoseonensis]SDE93728.1 Protein of unknown function [Limimaricola pyoseonensis]